jgi:hypothetical protein
MACYGMIARTEDGGESGTMALEDWSALAEIIGNVAVIVTLAILAVQIRANTKAVRYQINLERYRALYMPDASDAAMRIQAKIAQVDGMPPAAAALKERYLLTDEEAVRKFRLHGHLFRMLESEFESFGASAELSRAIRIMFQAPDVGISWEQSHLSRSRSERFRQFVDAARAGGEP